MMELIVLMKALMDSTGQVALITVCLGSGWLTARFIGNLVDRRMKDDFEATKEKLSQIYSVPHDLDTDEKPNRYYTVGDDGELVEMDE